MENSNIDKVENMKNLSFAMRRLVTSLKYSGVSDLWPKEEIIDTDAEFHQILKNLRRRHSGDPQ